MAECTDTWDPIVGAETDALLNHLIDRYGIDEAGRDQLVREASSILSRCVSPAESHGSQTGLVIGYVQSGKTMSFTTVATLARDNNYRLVIVITGTSKPLTNQSVERLKKDLRLDERPDRAWWFCTNPRTQDSKQPIQAQLSEWDDPNTPAELRQTVLIAVMKHHKHLAHLAQLLKGLSLHSVPTLIIDDEGDQASLNTQISSGDQSTTYRRILQLREVLDHCSYLQYTATPQAPLLINIIDTLSPSFAEILEPGREYVGGEEFFVRQLGILRTIPASDVFSHKCIPEEPPASLIEALRVFFIGVAVGSICDNEYGNRTMLIHPSHRTMPHTVFTRWVENIRDLFVEVLGITVEDPDRIDLLQEFRRAYDDLCDTAENLPDFENVVARLPRAMRTSVVQTVNATQGKTPIIMWRNSYSHILVGGQAMDRGFTVEGLTVTYMSRSLGVGNADTIQQRARFFGYKKSYLQYCRIYLGFEVSEAYQKYVNHEKSIRSELLEFQETGKPLEEWRRQFLMPARLRPTRSNVVDIEYERGRFAEQWFVPASPHIDEHAVLSNRTYVNEFLATVNLSPDSGHNERTEWQRHLQNENVPLREVHERLLTRLRFSDTSFAGVLLQIRNHLDHDFYATCTVFKMSCNRQAWLTRRRGVDAHDRILNLMQGAHPNRSGRIYRGDRNIGDKNRVIIQVHKLDLTHDRKAIATDVMAVAIWLPESLSAGWLIQDHG